MISSYTIHDILGSLLACGLFPLVMVIPGYVAGWLFDLFDFRKRLPLAKFLISLVASIMISPILVYWSSYFISTSFALIVLFVLLIVAAVILLFSYYQNLKTDQDLPSYGSARYKWLLISLAVAWVVFCVLWLVDWQFDQRLYFNFVAGDLETRVALVDAITRTGVPPINPGYYPGEPHQLTFLYYFWYILGSMADIVGGKWVTAGNAMIASIIWCGFLLFATIALYMRLRTQASISETQRRIWIGVALLAVSGLDAIPAISFMFMTKFALGSMWPYGDIEHWNEQITAWVGSIAWVPHHLSAALACLAGLMLFIYIRKQAFSRQIIGAIFTGFAFASAIGLSVWVTLVFVIFWGFWIIARFVQKSERQLIVPMLLAGIVAIIAASPFLLGLLGGGSNGSSAFPITLEIRRFHLVTFFFEIPSNFVLQMVNLFLLPVNYLMELGFYFMIAIIWIRQKPKSTWKDNPFYIPEILLLIAVLIIASFVRSTAIKPNDLGWRSWIFGQFILLIWAVDIFSLVFTKANLKAYKSMPRKSELRKKISLLTVLITLGVFTSVLDIALLRTSGFLVDAGITGFPNNLSPDTQLGSRTYAARQAYEFIRDNLPEDIIAQDNPATDRERPRGLYGTRQMVISKNTAYGVPVDVFDNMVDQVKVIFETEILTWEQIDPRCQQHSIDLLIIKDIDPIWASVDNLSFERPPIYKNDYYALFRCGANQ